MEYAKNDRTVSFVLGESWSYPGGDITQCPAPATYALSYAREFRYDSGRERYLNRTLSTSALLQSEYTPTSSTWSEYDGDDVYGDFTVSGSTVTMGNLYEPGLWGKESGVNQFLHNDHQGTLRNTSSLAGAPGTPRVFTAFGERIAGPSALDRYGYAGASGYQTHSEFPYQHVGARYYDPSSGRFLQRDPIGVAGGINVYLYALGNPAVLLDPSGLWSFWNWVYTGDGNSPDDIYDAAVDAAGDYINGSSPVRGGYAGVGAGGNRGPGASVGGSWSIDGGASIYGGAGWSSSGRARDPITGRYSSGTGVFGYGGSYGEGGYQGSFFGEFGGNQRGRGGHIGISSCQINIGINFGIFHAGVVIDLSRL